MIRVLTLWLCATTASAFVAPMRQPLTANGVSVAHSSSTSMSAIFQESDTLTKMDLPERLYTPQQKEIPKILGGLKVGLREIVVITGASSGLGLATAVSLAKTGKYFIVMAVRDVEKAKTGESVHDN